MDENLIESTLDSVRNKLENMKYGKIIIHIYGDPKRIDIEEAKRERIEIEEDNENRKYHKG